MCAAAVIQQPLPLPEIGAQTGDFGLRPEAGTQQAVFVQTLQPLCVADVGLAPGHVLRVPGVDHHHLEPSLFQDFEDRNPVNTGRFHDDRLDPAPGEPVRQPVKIIGKRPERSNRFFVAIWTDGRDMYCGADIDRRRGRVDRDQISRFTRPLRLRHAVNPPARESKRGAGPRRKINFLIGIARRRHHSQVRNSPWATFFYGVRSTKNFSAAPLRFRIARSVSTATGGPPIRARFLKASCAAASFFG